MSCQTGVPDHNRPRRRLRRWEHRAWVCSCGRLWRTRWHGAYDGGDWAWEEVRAVSDQGGEGT